FGKKRFADLLASGEGISTNILTERLERLQREGIITKQPYQDRPRRYEYVLTPKGRDLEPLLRELVRWGGRHVKGALKPPPGF
ncbi:MAG: winged helix-turn-helix transcriptional regulator, partial [Vicinamibacterales bacterium]